MKLIQIRDNKRNQMQELFAQKKKIMETMNTLNKELMSLDDDINMLEDQQHNHNSGDYTTMMTCNPEEILTEPTQPTQKQSQTQFESSFSVELLTDPLTSYTQTQQYQEPPPPEEEATRTSRTTIIFFFFKYKSTSSDNDTEITNTKYYSRRQS